MEDFAKWPMLAAINSPADVKSLPVEQLPALAAEIREYLAFRVSENGGHLASNLGVVELTMALHRVFDTPKDRIIFDVGHQSYVHKLLTGRKEQFDTLRQAGGISGFTKRSESEHDAFGAGHSSTAVSAAIGMAEAAYRQGSDAYTVAVVGDGALTGGLSYEGLNNCAKHLKLIIVINENEMSISPNTGRLATHLSRLRGSQNYLKTKELTSGAIRKIPLVGRGIYKAIRWCKRRVKHIFYRSNLFEHMGIRYVGPVDGNDIANLEACLRHARHLGTSVILHVKTKKGQGYGPAEADPNTYHSLPPCGQAETEKSFSAAFGEELTRLAEADGRICAITAAMSCGTGLEPFRLAHPQRFYDVGIAEGHALTFAAGLSAGGMRPVVAVYSTFLQRAFDNLWHDAALQQLPLVLAIDRAGLNGRDGPTHHGILDVAMLSAMPHVRIYTPVTRQGICRSLQAALQSDTVAAIRYPAGTEHPEVLNAFYPDGSTDVSPGVRTYGKEDAAVTLITHGRMAAVALKVAERCEKNGISAKILLCEYIAPYGELAAELAPLLGAGYVLFLEEEIRAGGFGMHLSDALAKQGAMKGRPFDVMGTVDAFATPESGKTSLQAVGLDEDSIFARITAEMREKEN